MSSSQEPVITEINDARLPGDFKGISFSKFKKVDVRKQLLNSLIFSKIEPACYWSAELICAGHYSDLWEVILFFYCKYIHLANPKLAIYLEMRTLQFKEIVSGAFSGHELLMRNHPKIRQLFCEIVCVLCDSKKKHTLDDIKINHVDFDMTHMTDRFKAPDIKYAENVFLKDDPRDLFIPMNELGYNISKDGRNVIQACYWIEWIMEYESNCKHEQNQKKKETKTKPQSQTHPPAQPTSASHSKPTNEVNPPPNLTMIEKKGKCQRRNHIPVNDKDQTDIVWMIWDLFFKEMTNHPPIIQKIIKALLTLFTLKYTNACFRRRKYILYFIVELLTERFSMEEEIIREKHKEVIVNIVNHIDHIYQQIKQNEESPTGETSSKNAKNVNLERTIKKLDTINQFNENFIPRI